MDMIKNAISTLLAHKSKIFVSLLSAILFIALLFPFGDLVDLISTQVSRLTNNKVYLALENMKLSFLPTPGMKLERVFVETASIAGLSVKELTVTPSVSGLASQKPYGHVNAKGILGGNIDLHVQKGAPTDNGLERQKLDLKAERIQLNDIKSLATLPIQMRGQLNLDGQALIDLTFQEQPDVDLKLQVAKLEIPPSSINTMMGPLSLPDVKLSKLELKGRWAAGRFIIENGNLGSAGDELSGTIKGSIDVRMQSAGGRTVPVMGAYNLELDLMTTPGFQEKAGLFLTFISAYKRETASGAQYKFRVSAANTQMPPSINAVR